MNPWLDALRALPWVLGLTLLLAAASDALHRRRSGRGFRALLADASHATAIDLGLALFTLGLLLSADPWWERIIWGAFLAYYSGSLVWRLRRGAISGGNACGPLTPTLSPEYRGEGVLGPSPRTRGEGTGEASLSPSPCTRGEGAGEASLSPSPCTRGEGTSEASLSPSPCTRGEGTGEGSRAVAIARWAEPVAVALAAPFLWFPTQYPPLTITALALIAVTWAATSLLRRRFWPAAPWNLALGAFVFMAAVGTVCSAVWDLTLPKVTGLVLGLAVYRALAEFARNRRSLLLALAGLVVVAAGFSAMGLLFGELRADKIPFIAALRVRIPQLDAALPGTQGGRVSTNQLGGTILFVLPLLIGPLLVWRRPPAPPRREWRLWLALSALGALVLSGALLLTQSRGAYVGMAAGVACLVGLRWRWGRWALLAGAVVLGVGVWRFWPAIAAQLARNPATTGLASPGTLLWRVEVWERSIAYLGDVPFTGYGLGTFRAVDTLFYGPGIIGTGGESSVFDVGVPHAHNVFLQMGYDVGIPGLLAYLAILLLAGQRCWSIARREPGLYGALGMGALAALVASHVYGLVDVVALGAKPGVLWWGLLAFVGAMPHHGGTGGTEE